jgi:protein-tyrosine phosphatase
MEVLFLCTGNYYRSRFAEELFNHLAAQQDHPARASSRGLAVERGIFNFGPISTHTIKGLEQRGITITKPMRKPQALTEFDLQNATLIVAVKEAEHRPLMQERFPEWVSRVRYWAIHDLDQETPETALAALDNKVRQLFQELASS